MCENEPKRIKNLEERAVKNSRSPKRNNSSEDTKLIMLLTILCPINMIGFLIFSEIFSISWYANSMFDEQIIKIHNKKYQNIRKMIIKFLKTFKHT